LVMGGRGQADNAVLPGTADRFGVSNMSHSREGCVAEGLHLGIQAYLRGSIALHHGPLLHFALGDGFA